VVADQHLVGLQEHIIQRERSAGKCLKYAAAFGKTVGLACHRVQEHPARRERYAAPVLNQQAAAAASRKSGAAVRSRTVVYPDRDERDANGPAWRLDDVKDAVTQPSRVDRCTQSGGAGNE